MTGADFWKPYDGQLPGGMVVYPHTRNQDFVALILAKWSAGIQLRLGGKGTLFRIPLFLKLAGELQAAFARIAALMEGVRGPTPAHAAPVCLLEK